MFVTFLDKLGGWFDRRFMLAFWAPAFISLGVTGSLIVLVVLGRDAVDIWDELDSLESAWLALVALVLITVTAYVLQAFSTTIVRLHEGYLFPEWLARHTRADQLRARQRTLPEQRPNRLTGAATSAWSNHYRDAYFYFPRNEDLVKPTRLGNVLTASEEYVTLTYGADAVLWWPRLAPLLPQSFREQVDSTLTPMLSLLTLSTTITLAGLISAVVLALFSPYWWLGILCAVMALALARLCYVASISQAVSYGDLVRAAFDLYRHEILKQMRLPLPKNLREDFVLWQGLTQFIYLYTPPWDVLTADEASQVLQIAKRNPLADPLPFAGAASPPPASKTETVNIVISIDEQGSDAARGSCRSGLL
jgi:hypothetical protein